MEAVLWDLDGTLLHSGPSIRTAMAHVLREQQLPMFTAREVEGVIGKPLREILSSRTDDGDLVEHMVRRFREVYNGYAWVFAEPVPRIEQVLAGLQSRGMHQAIVTTKGEEEARLLVRDLGLAHWFDAVVGDDDRRALKPDPAPVAEACTRLAAAPAAAVMVGDTPFDVAAGRAAGCRTVGVLWGAGTKQTLHEAGADVLVSDPRDLLGAIRSFA